MTLLERYGQTLYTNRDGTPLVLFWLFSTIAYVFLAAFLPCLKESPLSDLQIMRRCQSHTHMFEMLPRNLNYNLCQSVTAKCHNDILTRKGLDLHIFRNILQLYTVSAFNTSPTTITQLSRI